MKKELLPYAALAGFLKEALGEAYQVFLVDADHTGSRITAGDSGLHAGESADPEEISLFNDILASTELKNRDYLTAYTVKDEGESKKRCSVFYIRDTEGDISGFLCLKGPSEGLYRVSDIFDQILTTDEEPTSSTRRIEEEVDLLMQEKIRAVWERYTSRPGKLKKADKIAFVTELFDMGIFRIRGGAFQVSEITGISPASLYRYLGEVIEE